MNSENFLLLFEESWFPPIFNVEPPSPRVVTAKATAMGTSSCVYMRIVARVRFWETQEKDSQLTDRPAAVTGDETRR